MTKSNTDNKVLGVYIGETSRHLKQRMTEHIRAVVGNDFRNSSMVDHFNNIHIRSSIAERTFTPSILEKCYSFLDRKILESIYIINSKPDINKNTGLFLTT
jgi:hypothetical protein